MNVDMKISEFKRVMYRIHNALRASSGITRKKVQIRVITVLFNPNYRARKMKNSCNTLLWISYKHIILLKSRPAYFFTGKEIQAWLVHAKQACIRHMSHSKSRMLNRALQLVIRLKMNTKGESRWYLGTTSSKY